MTEFVRFPRFSRFLLSVRHFPLFRHFLFARHFERGTATRNLVRTWIGSELQNTKRTARFLLPAIAGSVEMTSCGTLPFFILPGSSLPPVRHFERGPATRNLVCCSRPCLLQNPLKTLII